MATKQELINSIEFEDALIAGAECKKDMVTSYKHQNKANFNSFYEIMLSANSDIQKILDIKKKYRSEDDTRRLNEFKQNVRAMYSQAQALTVKEDLDDGKKTKIEKIVDKIVPVIDILRYIGFNELDNEFKKHGLILTSSLKLEDKYPGLDSDDKRKIISDIFNTASNIRQKTIDDNTYINEDLFSSKVPIELQYDKGTNNTGLKIGDWRKLVDAKAKLIMASTKEAKDKVEEKIEHIASEKQFEMARAELVRDKLMTIQ